MTALAQATNRSSFLLPIILAAGLGIGAVLLPIEVTIVVVALCTLLLLVIHTPITLLTLLLVLSPLRTLIATESNISIPLDIGQILLIVYLGGWVLHRIKHHRQMLAIKSSMPLLVILFVIAIFGLNVWSSTSISAWITEWLKWVIIGVFVWHLTLSEKNSWQWLLYAVIVSAIANAIVGLYIFFGGSGADHLLIGGRFFRAFGTFGQPNPFGGFMGITLPIALMGLYSQFILLWKTYSKTHHIAYQTTIKLILFGIVVVILFAALIASWSRGAWLGFIISVGIMAFAIPRRLVVSVSLTFGLAILIFGLWIGGLIPQSIINRLTTAATDFITIDDIRGVDITSINYAVVERVAHWQAAINMAEAHPIAGVGLGNYEIVYNNYRLLNWKEPLGHAHNYYLNILGETGMIGFLAYVAFWIVIFTVTWKTRQHPDVFSRSIAIGLLGSWTYVAVHSVFDNLYVNNLFLHIGVLLSMISILHNQLWKTIKLE